MTLVLRDAAPGDEALISRFVQALAAYEKLSHEAVASEEDFRRALFNTPQRCWAMFAEQDSTPVGFALWFYMFSTFTGRASLFVEDVFVLPEHRGQGVGRSLFAALAQRAVQEGCVRMEWTVLNWNETARRFYRGLGAQPMDEWTVQRLSGAALVALAEGALHG
jgi:GNAT superfamily N-acetyltransferase